MAEQALAELEEKRKQTTKYYEKVREDTPKIEIDPRVEKEIEKMRNKMVGPDGQMEETKLPMAMQMTRYPSIESVDFDPLKSNLPRRERQKYEEKERIIDAKLEIAQTVLTERLTLAEDGDQRQLLRAEYASICDELNRRKRLCQDMLAVPSFIPMDYPEQFEIKTPPNRELTTEEFDYYLEMEEKLKRWDGWAQNAYLDRLKDIENSQEKEQCYKSQERYVAWSQSIQAKLRYAFQPRRNPEKGLEDEQSAGKEQENEYLDLEQPGDVPVVRRVSRQELDLMFGTGITPTPNMPSPQKAMNEKIPEILRESRVTTPISDEGKRKKGEPPLKEKPLQQREKITKTHISPIGGNTIPIKYSKEIGRYGGIERLTSTEARQSQNNAVQTAKDFFEKQENVPRKEKSTSLNGAPMEELDWDYHDGTVQVPTTRSDKMAPDVVVETQKRMDRQERGNISPSKGERPYGRKRFTSLRPFKEAAERPVKQPHRVTTLPWPTSPKIYKRKTGDPMGKTLF